MLLAEIEELSNAAREDCLWVRRVRECDRRARSAHPELRVLLKELVEKDWQQFSHARSLGED